MNDNSKPKPGDGGEFEKIVRFGDYLLENIDSSYPKIGRLYRQLKEAHAADRAADRAEIEQLKAELDTLKTPCADLRSLIIEYIGNWAISKKRERLLKALSARENTFKSEVTQLKADKAELVEALEHIMEYWNRDRNDTAMHDALWHIIGIADELIAKHTEAGNELK